MATMFKLAPMSRDLRVASWALSLVPAVFVGAALVAPPPVSWLMAPVALFVVLLYAGVWLAFRPSRFEVDVSTLRVQWPVRGRTIARADIESARLVTSAEFRSEYGLGMRIGAGGLWGGFGLLKTGRETFSMWISRTDQFVIVQLRGERPLLVTPEQPQRFVDMLTRRVAE